jgi:5-formyltetrahydrofolate cyclo-ligase
MRRLRQGLNPQAQRLAAESAARRVPQLPGWSTASSVGLYLAHDSELDTVPLADACRAAGKTCFLPVIGELNSLVFAQWSEHCALVQNRYGIPEPGGDIPRLPVAALDVLFLPLVAWDKHGGRLGMGGGYYDRTLAGHPGVLLVGLAYSVQEIPRVPRDNWDIKLDFVVTDSALTRCQGSEDCGGAISPG